MALFGVLHPLGFAFARIDETFLRRAEASVEGTQTREWAKKRLTAVLVRLSRNLAPGQHPSLRIGGGTTDSSWRPVRGVLPPAGVSYGLTARCLITTCALAQDLGARLVLGVNLASDHPLLAAAEARAMLRGIGRSRVSALEIGNEPDIYNHFPRHRAPSGHIVSARPPTYDLAVFLRQVARVGSALPRATLAGPTLATCRGCRPCVDHSLPSPGLGMVTFHRYPLSCFARPGSPKYPTIADLLSNHASTGLADSVARFVAIAHSRGLPFRLDEINSVARGGTRGVSNTFASALWVLDTLFETARVGVDGVYVHTLPGARYQPFAFTHTRGALARARLFRVLRPADVRPGRSDRVPTPAVATCAVDAMGRNGAARRTQPQRKPRCHPRRPDFRIRDRDRKSTYTEDDARRRLIWSI
jgi:hypothetical protein